MQVILLITAFASAMVTAAVTGWGSDLRPRGHEYEIGNCLRPGEALYRMDGLWSPNGKNVLVMQNDGNVVVYTRNCWQHCYDVNGNWVCDPRKCDWNFRAIWDTNTQNLRPTAWKFEYTAGGDMAVIGDPDGNGNWVRRNYGTSARDGLLCMQNDGNLVLYNAGWNIEQNPVWASYKFSDWPLRPKWIDDDKNPIY
ncbi:hypothetical protein BDR26DRAFT_862744 [Obelidium mucronatum]|nr:hypothetical protein BDR26DRAFT_862744 [Obelidium mucronatum]